ncbi:MAG: glutamate--tRNA ligase [Nanoarchaeota archaeon]|nr:glutamate--tRNA ligase [Nanoarchaeota archaeon]
MLEKEIKAYALRNAIEYGKASPDRILPKLFQHGLQKENIKEIMPEIKKITDEVNALSKEDQQTIFANYKDMIKERVEKEKTLPELPNAIQGKVLTRIAPEPSKYLHIGHAISFLLNSFYAEKYKGKCLIRFDDANPEKVSQDYVDSILDDIKNYLAIKPNKIKFISDDMKIFYQYAEKLIKDNHAFMCFCDREKMQKLRHDGIECSCRQKDTKTQMKEWKDFLKGKYKVGKAVLRIKGNMQDSNHVMRDPVIFRSVKEAHFRTKTKYKVWPMYDFYSPVEDSIMGVTHILRSNEFDQRVPLHNLISHLLKLKQQEIIQYGRFNVMDATTKGREIRDLIKSGEFIGWDDPRLVTLKALKRRGITKEAFLELLNHIGLVKHDVNLDFNMIASINRKIIDPIAKRYYFVDNPLELDIKNAPSTLQIEIPIHPNNPKVLREVRVTPGKVYISKKDFNEFKGKEVRLLHLYNIKLPSKGSKAEFTSIENKDIPKITWVSFPQKAKVLMPDGSWVEGLADENIRELKVDSIIQFERFGFVRLDKISKQAYEFWFAHR